MTAYLSDHDLKPKTTAGYRYEVLKYCKKPVNKITADEIRQWYLENKHIPTSIDKVIGR